jgi:hypothetical protein
MKSFNPIHLLGAGPHQRGLRFTPPAVALICGSLLCVAASAAPAPTITKIYDAPWPNLGRPRR